MANIQPYLDNITNAEYGEEVRGSICDAIEVINEEVHTGISDDIAELYDATKTYSVGDLVTYEDDLYECISKIETAEPWTAAHWKQTVLADHIKDVSNEIALEVNDLKSHLSNVENAVGYSPVQINVNKMIDTYGTGKVIKPENIAIYNGWCCVCVPCTEGDVFHVTGKGGATTRLWAFSDLTGAVISPQANSGATGDELEVIAPENAAYFAFNSNMNVPYDVYKGQKPTNTMSSMQTAIDEFEETVQGEIAEITEGGTSDYTPQTMDGWYYVESLENNAGRIIVHPTRGSRTFLIDVSDKPDSLQINISSQATRCRILYTTTSIDSVTIMTPGAYYDAGNGTKALTLNQENYGAYRTIAINTSYNRAPEYTDYETMTVAKTFVRTAVDRKAREMIENREVQNKFILYSTANELTDNSLILCSNIDNKKNSFYNVYAEPGTNFTSLCVGHGYNVSYSGYAMVDSTTLKWYRSNGELQGDPLEHHLDISNFFNIRIEQNNSGSATVILSAVDGEVSLENRVFAGSRGDVFCKAVGTVNNVAFSAGIRDLIEDVWFFGDSYVSIDSNARWPYYAVQNGHTKFYLNGFGGANASHAILSFRETLSIATPKTIIWGIGMNGSDTSSGINGVYKSALDEVMETCEEKNIELILCTIPNTPSRLHTYKNAFIKSSGYRYVDFAKAVGAEQAQSTWYPGMLEGENTESEETLTERVHPTALGAKTLYNRLITDAPEMFR